LRIVAAPTDDLPPLSGRIIIDTMNPVAQPGFRLADLGRLAWSDVVAQHVRGARIVKIANTLPPSLIHHRLCHVLN